MKKFILMSLCAICVACQQYNDVEEYMLRGYWQEIDRPYYYYHFTGASRFDIYNTQKPYDVCVKPFTYQIYNKQMITSAYYEIYDKQDPRLGRRFSVIYDYYMEGDSILNLSLKSFNKDEDYEDPRWTPQKKVKLLRINYDKFGQPWDE